MPLPIAKYKLIRRIDRDRDEMERIGKGAALRIGLQARRLAYAAWRTTRDVRAVVQAVRAALLGDDRLDQPGIVELVRDTMVAGHLSGWRRTALNVQGHTDDLTGRLRLSSAFDGAIEFLTKRLQLSEGELQDISDTYDSAALRVVRTSTTSLEQALQESVLESTAAGEGVSGGVAALRRAFENEGFTPGSDHQLEAIFRTQTQTAYHAGRWESLNDPALGDLLWGFEYTAIRDDRTTQDICRPLDGMKRLKTDDVWTRLWPPNHWNCRSTPLELFGQNQETDVPDVQAQDGFGFNPGMVFGVSDDPLSLAYDESKHRRDASGKFSSTGGGGSGKTKKKKRGKKREDEPPATSGGSDDPTKHEPAVSKKTLDQVYAYIHSGGDVPNEHAAKELRPYRLQKTTRLYKGVRKGDPGLGANVSWTKDIDVARSFAGDNGHVISAMVTPEQTIVDLPHIQQKRGWRDPFIDQEQEVLVRRDAKLQTVVEPSAPRGASVGPPPVLPKTTHILEGYHPKVKEAIRELIDYAKPGAHERRMILDPKTGDMIENVHGEATSVPLPTVSRVLGKEGLIDIHTHPETSSFSDGDWGQFAWSHVGHMVVITPEKSFVLKKTPKYESLPYGDRSPRAVTEAWNEISTRLITDHHSDWSSDQIIHETNKELANKLGVEYTEHATTPPVEMPTKRTDITPISKKTRATIEKSFTGAYHEDAVGVIARMHKWGQQTKSNLTQLTKAAEKHVETSRLSWETIKRESEYMQAHGHPAPKYLYDKGKTTWLPGDATPPDFRKVIEKHLQTLNDASKKVTKIQARINQAGDDAKRKAFDDIVGGRSPSQASASYENVHDEVTTKVGFHAFQQLTGSAGGNDPLDGSMLRFTRTAAGSKHEHRSYANGNTAFMAKGAPVKTVVHELGHVWENVDPAVHREAVDFLERRTKGEADKSLADVRPGWGYDRDEITKEDKFIDPYIGKQYTFPTYHNGATTHERYATEVVSMGLEHMYHDPIGFAQKDPDHFAFIYSLLRRQR